MASEESRKESSARRNQYKELLDAGAEIEAAVANESPVSILKRIADLAQRSDDINAQGRFQDRVENTSEVVMDAQVMKMAHELLGSLVNRMDNAEIPDDEFVAAVNRTIGPEKDWKKFGEMALRCSRTFTYSQPMFGTFDEESVIPQKEVKEQRKNNPPAGKAPEVRPVAVREQKTEEEEARSVNAVFNRIKELYNMNNKKPYPLFKLVIDPQNFMRTINNAMKVSHLVRDACLVIDEDELGYPTVRPVEDGDGDDFEDVTHQMVANFSGPFCREMIAYYNITEPMLPSSFD